MPRGASEIELYSDHSKDNALPLPSTPALPRGIPLSLNETDQSWWIIHIRKVYMELLGYKEVVWTVAYISGLLSEHKKIAVTALWWICRGRLVFECFAAAAAKSLQSCPTLCDPIYGSPPGSAVPGILQARTLEWVAISFSNAWKGKVKEARKYRKDPQVNWLGWRKELACGILLA